MMIYLLYYDYSFGSVYSISAGEFEVLFVSFFVLNSAMWCGVVWYGYAAGVLVVRLLLLFLLLQMALCFGVVVGFIFFACLLAVASFSCPFRRRAKNVREINDGRGGMDHPTSDRFVDTLVPYDEYTCRGDRTVFPFSGLPFFCLSFVFLCSR